MRDLVEHPSTGLVLDFSKVDFGGPGQAAVVDAFAGTMRCGGEWPPCRPR
jgi:hypothetical protein